MINDKFFILTHSELAKEQAKRNKRENMSWVENAEKSANGVDNVLKIDLDEYLNKWEKIAF